MGGIVAVWLLGAGFLTAPADDSRLQRFEFARTEMAVPIKLVFYAPDGATAKSAAEAAFGRIHQLNGILSDYDPASELRRLCDTAGEGKAVPVSEDLWKVLMQSIELSDRSGGAFDVTVGPIVRLWRRARRSGELPPQKLLSDARQLVGYKLVRLDAEHKTVALAKAGMRLDLGGIAKGYALDQALEVLRKHGIRRAIIHAGGDIGVGDPPPGETGWKIGVGTLDVDAKPARYLSVARCGVATSGDMFQFVEIGGRRYSHLVDPHTGVGLTDHSNVTVVAPNGTLSDGLASAVSVLGPKEGLKLVEATPGVAAFILRAPAGKVEVHESSRWKDLPVPGSTTKRPTGP